MMRSLLSIALLLILAPSCSVFSRFPSEHITNVNLASDNFRVVKQDAQGTDGGFALLGIIPIITPSSVDAMSDLMRSYSGVGKPTALANVGEAVEADYFILFSLTRVRVRADIVEFVE